jgi:hypothetical protein
MKCRTLVTCSKTHNLSMWWLFRPASTGKELSLCLIGPNVMRAN